MTLRKMVVVVALLGLTAACGTRVTQRQAAQELREDAVGAAAPTATTAAVSDGGGAGTTRTAGGGGGGARPTARQGGLGRGRARGLPADDALDSGKNRAAHLQLKDKVFAFVGSFSVNDDGGAAVVNQCACPDISGNLSQPMQNSQYHYGPQPQPLGWRSGPPRWYAQKFGKDVIEHWAFFVGQNAASEAIGANMRKVYEKEGFKVVYTRTVPPNDNNQTADVVQMQRAGVRAISWEGDLAGMSKLAAAMRQQNFSVDFANWGGSM